MAAAVAVPEPNHADLESEDLLVPNDLEQANAHRSRWTRVAAGTFALGVAGVAVGALIAQPSGTSLALANVFRSARKYTSPKFNYNDLGPGKCLSSNGQANTGTFLQCSDMTATGYDSQACGVGFTTCAQVCDASVSCDAYAQSDYMNCMIYYSPVKAGGPTWGESSCMQKASMAGSSCFPGQAEVLLKGRGRAPISSIKVGDEVLVEEGRGGELQYEAVIGFLHFFGVGRSTSFLNIEHAGGNLRVSANHVVFVGAAAGGRAEKIASEVREGDELLLAGAGGGERRSRVASVRSVSGDQGMVAPLTPKGTIVVDGALASNYATVGRLRIPHGAMHATLFLARACAQLGLDALFAPGPTAASSELMHPIVSFLHRSMHIEKLIS